MTVAYLARVLQKANSTRNITPALSIQCTMQAKWISNTQKKEFASSAKIKSTMFFSNVSE